MFVESEVGELIEKTLPPFDEILSGIKHSIPIFVVMPDHSSVNTPFKISPVESIRRMAEVLLRIGYHNVSPFISGPTSAFINFPSRLERE